MDVFVAQPSSYSTFLGLVWLAVVVTLGVRSVTAAVLGGLAFSLLPGVLQTYVPARWGELPSILFGLGAIAVARNPEGAVLHTGRQVRHLLAKVIPHQATPAAAIPALVDEAPPVSNTEGSDATSVHAGVKPDTSGSMIKAKP
jgi:branched-chain amino acid transport system permease protein